MTALTLVKFGGSVLTEKAHRESARTAVLARLCRELADGVRGPCVLGHGSGSFGHRAAADQGFGDGVFSVSDRAAAIATQQAARRLHQLVVDNAIEAGIPAASLPPAGWSIDVDGELEVDLSPLRSALESGATPVVMGDVVWCAGGGARVASTEEVLEIIGRALPVARAIWVSDTDGVLDPEGRTLETLTASDQPQFGAPVGADVTGGMARRWRAVRNLAQRGVESLLVNGLREGELQAALAGGPVHGTRVTSEA